MPERNPGRARATAHKPTDTDGPDPLDEETPPWAADPPVLDPDIDHPEVPDLMANLERSVAAAKSAHARQRSLVDEGDASPSDRPDPSPVATPDPSRVDRVDASPPDPPDASTEPDPSAGDEHDGCYTLEDLQQTADDIAAVWRPTPMPAQLLGVDDPLWTTPEGQRAMWAHLRRPFPPAESGKLPRAKSKNGWKGRCAPRSAGGEAPDDQDYFCGGWHSLPAVHLDYVGHAAVTKRLDECDPAWQWWPSAGWLEDGRPRCIHEGGKPRELWIWLSIYGVTRPGVGTIPAGQDDPYKVLIGDAMRNAALRFGIAVDLWIKGHGDGDTEEVSNMVEPPADQTPLDEAKRDAIRERANALPGPARKALKDMMIAQHVAPDIDELTEQNEGKIVAMLTSLESRARGGEFDPKPDPDPEADAAPWDPPANPPDDVPAHVSRLEDDDRITPKMTAAEVMALCSCDEPGCVHEVEASGRP